MTRDILIFWRLPDGTRCSVAAHPTHGWQLVVTRMATVLLTEHFSDAHRLLARAHELRPLFLRSVA